MAVTEDLVPVFTTERGNQFSTKSAALVSDAAYRAEEAIYGDEIPEGLTVREVIEAVVEYFLFPAPTEEPDAAS